MLPRKYNGHGPSANSTNSSGLSHLFQEQTIHFSFSCYVSALEYNLPSASDEAGGRNIVVDRTPHDDPICSIEQIVDMTRSRSIEFLIRQPEVNDYEVSWYSRHGSARFVAVPKASGRYNTRSAAAKTKRS